MSLFFSMKEAPQRLVLIGSCIPHAWNEVLAGFYVPQNAGSTLSHFCIRNSHFFAGVALSLLSGRAAANSAHFDSHLCYFKWIWLGFLLHNRHHELASKA